MSYQSASLQSDCNSFKKRSSLRHLSGVNSLHTSSDCTLLLVEERVLNICFSSAVPAMTAIDCTNQYMTALFLMCEFYCNTHKISHENVHALCTRGCLPWVHFCAQGGPPCVVFWTKGGQPWARRATSPGYKTVTQGWQP